jgi:LPS sulfotransferase NodH
MWGTLEEIVAKVGSVHADLAGADMELLTRVLGRTRFVHLWRDDVVAQAVSWGRAEQTQFWQDGDTALPGHEPHFDFQQIHALIETIDEHNAGWRDWFAALDVKPHGARYEDLIADPDGVTRGILDFVGLRLAADRVLEPGTRRQADQLNDDWIAEYPAFTGLVG